MFRASAVVIRYAYGDIVQIMLDECPNCGFMGKRMKFIGRSDDMLIVKGSNIYPAALQKIVASFFPRVTGAVKIVLNEPPPRVVPPLKMKIEFSSGTISEQLDGLAAEIKDACRRKVKVNPEIIWVEPGTFEKSLRKSSPFEKLY